MTGPIRIDIQVRQGAILRGQVIDSKTGKGVRSYIQVKPTPGNILLNKPNLLNEHSTTSEPDGTFRLIAPPGDILVTASPSTEEKADGPMPYVPAKILPSHHGLLQQRGGDRESVHFQGQNQPVKLGYAYQLLELPAEGETTVELTMSRGKERTLLLVDPEGKPMESATIAGLDQTMQPLTVKGGTQQIVGLNSTEKTRNLFILDRTRKLGALAAVFTIDSDPLTVKLEPLASFSGRIVDGENKPRVGMPLAIKPVLNTDRPGPTGVATQSWHPQTLQLFFPTVNTDQDGRFTMTDILPNVELQFFSVQSGTSSWLGRIFMENYKLKPGEQRALGDMKVQDINPQRPNFKR